MFCLWLSTISMILRTRLHHAIHHLQDKIFVSTYSKRTRKFEPHCIYDYECSFPQIFGQHFIFTGSYIFYYRSTIDILEPKLICTNTHHRYEVGMNEKVL
jgi:hypothetical protein